MNIEFIFYDDVIEEEIVSSDTPIEEILLLKGEPGDPGQDGQDGQDGVSPELSETKTQDGYDITITDVNGTRTISLKDGDEGPEGPPGADGEDGKDGEDGYTPVKGVDYFTEEDITEIENDVISSINIPTALSELSDDSTHRLVTDTEKTTWNNKSDFSGSYDDLTNKPSIPTTTNQLTNDSGFITKDVNNLTYYTLKTATGSLIDLEINQSTYVVTLKLKDIDGNVISTDTIDLPLESVVIGGTFDSVNKKIVLTLENGNTVDIPVGDLVAGLQTEITSSNKLASDLVDDTNSGNKFTNTSEKTAWNAKYDKPSGGIPKTDLTSDVQTSLGKADTALQEHQSLANYVKNTDYATSSKGGVFKTQANYATNMYQGYLYANGKTYSDYLSASPGMFIGKQTLENVITGKQLINQTTLDESQAEQDAKIEELKENNFDFDTASGENITITDSARYLFKEFNVGGNTKQATAILPDTYQQVDYIESSGTQYIDTGFKPKGDTSTIIDSIYTPLENSSTSIFGCQNYQAPAYINAYNFGNQTSSSYNYINKYNTLVNNYTATAEFYTGRKLYKLLKNKAYVDDTLINEFNYADFTCTYNAYLFALNYNSVVSGQATMKLYGCKIYDNDTLVRDFVPCYRISDSVVGLYDLVNNVFYTNAGTGAFTYGSTVSLPNPDFPIPVENVSGEVEVKVENKNIYNSSLAVNNMYQNYNNPYWSMSPNNSYWCTGLQKIKPNTNYTISTTPNITVCYDKDRKPIPQGLRGATITTQATAYYMNCCYTKNGLPFGSDLQIEEGSASTSYEPHEEQTATLTLPEGMEMCKIGTYQDSFVYQGGKWYKNKKVGKYVFNGTETVATTSGVFYFTFIEDYATSNNIPYCKCFKGVSNVSGGSNMATQSNNSIAFYNSSSLYRLYIKADDYTETTLKQFFTNNNTPLYYILKIPVLEEITDTTLISDLESLKNLYSYKGTTYISNNSEPSLIFEIEYAKDSYLPNALTALTDKIYAYVQDSIDESINQAIGGSY